MADFCPRSNGDERTNGFGGKSRTVALHAIDGGRAIYGTEGKSINQSINQILFRNNKDTYTLAIKTKTKSVVTWWSHGT